MFVLKLRLFSILRVAEHFCTKSGSSVSENAEALERPPKSPGPVTNQCQYQNDIDLLKPFVKDRHQIKPVQ